MKYANTVVKNHWMLFHFLKLMKEKMALMNIDQSLLSRSLNEGFSGGEKKAQ